jgi:hypothetical protein
MGATAVGVTETTNTNRRTTLNPSPVRRLEQTADVSTEPGAVQSDAGWQPFGGGVVAEFVRFTLDDGSEVVFESAESDLVRLHGGQPEVREGGRLTERLRGVAEAAEQVAGELGSRLAPNEVSLSSG